jgi:hypothetical protein
VRKLIQVCYSVEDFNTRWRVINALLKASKEVGCGNLNVITWDYEGIEEVERRIVDPLSGNGFLRHPESGGIS